MVKFRNVLKRICILRVYSSGPQEVSDRIIITINIYTISKLVSTDCNVNVYSASSGIMSRLSHYKYVTGFSATSILTKTLIQIRKEDLATCGV